MERPPRDATGIWRRAGDEWMEVVGWTPCPVVQPGTGENTVELQLGPDQVVFTVNGSVIATPANTLVGGIGVFLGGDGNEAVLTRLSVSALN